MFVAQGAARQRPVRVAVIGFGDTTTARRVAAQLSEAFGEQTDGRAEFQVIDADQTKAAAKGTGYNGSLNMTLEEARNLAAAIGCDFFFTGIAQTLRRSPSNAPVYFESYASLFLVSARTG